jgi:hypothetical protein
MKSHIKDELCNTTQFPAFTYLYTKPDDCPLGPKHLQYWIQDFLYSKLWLCLTVLLID